MTPRPLLSSGTDLGHERAHSGTWNLVDLKNEIRQARGGMGMTPPIRKPRKPIHDFLTYLLARLVLGAFRIMPAPLARAFGRTLGALAGVLLRRCRRQIHRHLSIAFRETESEEQKRRWIDQNFRHIGQSLAEVARLNKLRKDNLDQLVDLEECAVLDDLLKKGNGKGILCVPAHHGNWELCGYAVALKGYTLKSVARPLDNPHLNALIMGIREASGNEMVEKWQVLWKLKKLLDKGNIVTLSVDQNGDKSGIFVPLFGALASTLTSPADLHLAAKVPIVVVSMNRQADGVHHKFHVWDVIEYEESEESEDRQAHVRRVTARVNAAYEKAIRAYPEQWLWVHKRWKTRPEGEQAGPDGLPPLQALEG